MPPSSYLRCWQWYGRGCEQKARFSCYDCCKVDLPCTFSVMRLMLLVRASLWVRNLNIFALTVLTEAFCSFPACQTFRGQSEKTFETGAMIKPLISVYDLLSSSDVWSTVVAHWHFQVILDLKQQGASSLSHRSNPLPVWPASKSKASNQSTMLMASFAIDPCSSFLHFLIIDRYKPEFPSYSRNAWNTTVRKPLSLYPSVLPYSSCLPFLSPTIENKEGANVSFPNRILGSNYSI